MWLLSHFLVTLSIRSKKLLIGIEGSLVHHRGLGLNRGSEAGVGEEPVLWLLFFISREAVPLKTKQDQKCINYLLPVYDTYRSGHISCSADNWSVVCYCKATLSWG